jgi:hypothetical protein
MLKIGYHFQAFFGFPLGLEASGLVGSSTFFSGFLVLLPFSLMGLFPLLTALLPVFPFSFSALETGLVSFVTLCFFGLLPYSFSHSVFSFSKRYLSLWYYASYFSLPLSPNLSHYPLMSAFLTFSALILAANLK